MQVRLRNALASAVVASADAETDLALQAQDNGYACGTAVSRLASPSACSFSTAKNALGKIAGGGILDAEVLDALDAVLRTQVPR